ncbi:LysR family transcriptional regulator [Streptomyces sp. NPDC058964]|uniref:helix-turn-helix domain-containing protein n=1 Tax=Streptomyces sp. NPDC058964 TaxID=3346681 RepID=UPI0036C9ADF9
MDRPRGADGHGSRTASPASLHRCGTFRSFNRAAQQSSITQPALTLSRTIAQLAAALNVRLLNRALRQVELTDAATEFLLRVEGVRPGPGRRAPHGHA